MHFGEPACVIEPFDSATKLILMGVMAGVDSAIGPIAALVGNMPHGP